MLADRTDRHTSAAPSERPRRVAELDTQRHQERLPGPRRERSVTPPARSPATKYVLNAIALPDTQSHTQATPRPDAVTWRGWHWAGATLSSGAESDRCADGRQPGLKNPQQPRQTRRLRAACDSTSGFTTDGARAAHRHPILTVVRGTNVHARRARASLSCACVSNPRRHPTIPVRAKLLTASSGGPCCSRAQVGRSCPNQSSTHGNPPAAAASCTRDGSSGGPAPAASNGTGSCPPRATAPSHLQTVCLTWRRAVPTGRQKLRRSRHSCVQRVPASRFTPVPLAMEACHAARHGPQPAGVGGARWQTHTLPRLLTGRRLGPRRMGRSHFPRAGRRVPTRPSNSNADVITPHTHPLFQFVWTLPVPRAAQWTCTQRHRVRSCAPIQLVCILAHRHTRHGGRRDSARWGATNPGAEQCGSAAMARVAI